MSNDRKVDLGFIYKMLDTRYGSVADFIQSFSEIHLNGA